MPPRGRFELPDPELNRQLEALLDGVEARLGASENREAVRQLVVAAVRLVSDRAARGDARLLANAVKELRHSFRVFAPYEHVRKVAVFGSARTEPDTPAFEQARRFAERIVAQGWMVITGAGDGIMGAAQLGAGREHSFGVIIRLPWEQHPNAVIAGDPKLVNFRYFFTRKLAFLKEAHAIALFPGGFGTHDEGFEALTLIQTGRSEILPVVFIDEPGGQYWQNWRRYVDDDLGAAGLISPEDVSLFRVTDDVDVAVREAVDFYRNYHSSRFVDDLLVLRVRVVPDAGQLAALNDEFADLFTSGRLQIVPPLAEEGGEVPEYARITLRFDRRRAGRLRLLIDRLNALATDRPSPRDASPRAISEGMPPEAER
ncbi:MAG TPA: LOG family protein [Gaiellaceae bacterium]|nr:LOG family protein [Gaiellaceae bacterium]